MLKSIMKKVHRLVTIVFWGVPVAVGITYLKEGRTLQQAMERVPLFIESMTGMSIWLALAVPILLGVAIETPRVVTYLAQETWKWVKKKGRII